MLLRALSTVGSASERITFCALGMTVCQKISVHHQVATSSVGMCKTEKTTKNAGYHCVCQIRLIPKFCDKMNDYILFKDINDKNQTL